MVQPINLPMPQKSTTLSIYLHTCMYVTPDIQVHVYIINTVLVDHSCRLSDSNYLGIILQTHINILSYSFASISCSGELLTGNKEQILVLQH